MFSLYYYHKQFIFAYLRLVEFVNESSTNACHMQHRDNIIVIIINGFRIFLARLLHLASMACGSAENNIIVPVV